VVAATPGATPVLPHIQVQPIFGMVWSSPRIAGYLHLYSTLCWQFVRRLLACYVVVMARIRSHLCHAGDPSSETDSSAP